MTLPRPRFLYDKGGSLLALDVALTRCELARWRGRDIPRWRERGLDPARSYRLLDNPVEWERAADARAFDRLPLTIGHHRPITPIGEIDNCYMDGLFLRGDVEVAALGAVDAIRSGERRQLSVSFLADVDWTPGSVVTEDGRRLAWDGVVHNIRGDHVALVRAGKSGPDCAIDL